MKLVSELNSSSIYRVYFFTQSYQIYNSAIKCGSVNSKDRYVLELESSGSNLTVRLKQN